MPPRIRLVEYRPPERRLEITALIDCVFLLLVFFLLTSSFTRQRDIPLDLTPVTSGEESEAASGSLDIRVAQSGALYVDDEAVTLGALRERLNTVGTQRSGRPVRILADENARAGVMLQVLDVARAAGLIGIDLVGTTAGGE